MLRKSTVSGVKWTSVSTIITIVLRFLQLAILARLLSPEDFGLMAMIMVVLGFAQSFADMGISNAIIHRQDTTREQLSSLYWINIIAGGAVFFLVVAATPHVVSFYKEPRLEELMFWAAMIFIVIPIGQQFQILLQKYLRFKELSLVEIVSALIGGVIAILSAVAGQGVLSLIWGQLSNSTSKTVILVGLGWKEWRPKLHFKRSDLRGYIGFGLYQMGEKSINYFNSRIDQLLIGTLLGAQALGYYSLAFNLVIQPIAKINPILTRVAFPVFAKIQTDTKLLRRGYIMVIKVISMINFPLLLGLAAVAPLLIPLIFGEQWLPAIVLVQILALVALIRSTGNPVGSLLLAKGRVALGFKWNFMRLVTQIIGVYAGAHFGGIIGVASVVLFIQVVYFPLSYLILIRTLIGRCLNDYLASMAPALALSAAMVMSVLFFARIVHGPAILVLAGQCVCGIVVYFTLNFLFQRQWLYEMKHLFFERA